VFRKGGSRRVAKAVANIVAKNGYRADLRKGTYILTETDVHFALHSHTHSHVLAALR
jgi:hypothetical protein